MATHGALTVRRSMTCDTSRVLGLLYGLLWGPSRLFGSFSGRRGPHWCRVSPWPLGAMEARICSSFEGAVGRGSVHLFPP
eukprot:3747809-Pyramimonas_sp.AAC.1